MPWLTVITFLICAKALFLWSAVAWHRFVLLNESPSYRRPFRHADRVVAYFKRSIWLSMLSFPIFLFFGFIDRLMSAVAHRGLGVQPGWGIGLLSLVISIPAGVLFLRMAVSLVAAALGAPQKVSDTCAATRGQLSALTVLFIALAAFAISGQAGSFVGLSPFSAMGALWIILTKFVSMALGLAVLTTLYGHYIERRPLL